MKNLSQSAEKVTDSIKRFKRYAPLLFCLLLLVIYSFLAYRITVLNHAEPSSDSTIQTNTAQVPRIDPTVVQQLQNLQDNSVSVKSLFDQARNSPFQE